MLRRALSLTLAIASTASMAFVPIGHAAAIGGNAYRVTRLVSDGSGATHVDPNLVGAWGLAAGRRTPWVVSDGATNVSTSYAGTGSANRQILSVPVTPTGVAFNGTSSFIVSDGRSSAPSTFLFSTLDGTIRGWNPKVPGPAPSFQSFVVKDRQAAGAGYEGLTTALGTEGPLVYATDFIGGRVDVFDGAFRQVHANAFVDPNLPHGFEPFGIQAIGGRIFVTYAARATGSKDQVDGAGLGFVDMFGREGRFLHRVASRHALNAPWGLAKAPNTFGRFSGDLLIGNSGDGRILAFEPRADGSFTQVGALRRADGTVIRIDGLRALEFGNGGAAGATNSLFFTAGPDGGNHGLFGVIATAR